MKKDDRTRGETGPAREDNVAEGTGTSRERRVWSTPTLRKLKGGISTGTGAMITFMTMDDAAGGFYS